MGIERCPALAGSSPDTPSPVPAPSSASGAPSTARPPPTWRKLVRPKRGQRQRQRREVVDHEEALQAELALHP
jgi:hypothetical protein